MAEREELELVVREQVSEALKAAAEQLDAFKARAAKVEDAGKSFAGLRQQVTGATHDLGNAANQLGTIGNLMMGFGKGLVGAGIGATLMEISNALGNFAARGVNLHYTAQEMGLTVHQMEAFNYAGKALGMTAEQTQQQLANFSARLIDIRKGAGSDLFIQLQRLGMPNFANMLREQIVSGGGQTEEAMKSYIEHLSRQTNPFVRRVMAEAVGISPRLAEAPEVLKRLPEMVHQNYAAQKEYNNAMAEFDVRLDNIRYTVGNTLLVELNRLTKWFKDHGYIEDFEKLARRVFHGLRDAAREMAPAVEGTFKGTLQDIENIKAAWEWLRQAAQAGGLSTLGVDPAQQKLTLMRATVRGEPTDKQSLARMSLTGEANAPMVSPAEWQQMVRDLEERTKQNFMPEEPMSTGRESMRLMRQRLGLLAKTGRVPDVDKDQVENAAKKMGEDLLEALKRQWKLLLADPNAMGYAPIAYRPRAAPDESGLPPAPGLEGFRAGGFRGGSFPILGSSGVPSASPVFRGGIGPGSRGSAYAPGGGGEAAGAVPTGRATGAQADRIAISKAAAIDQLRKEGVPEAHLEEAANLLVGQGLAESGLNPRATHDVVGGKPTGYGIYGARLDRRTSMLSWLREQGFEPDSLEGQTREMAHSAMTNPRFAATREALRNATPERRRELTNLLTRNFENPKGVNRRDHLVGQAAAIAARAAEDAAKPVSEGNIFRRFADRDANAPMEATSEHIRELQASATTRRGAISETLRSQLEYAGRQTGLTAEVTSGGQPASGRNRTGSHRHDLGGAADLRLRDPETGRMLDMRKPEDAARMAQFTREAVSAGATGVGAGMGYMGPHKIHIGGGPGAITSWGGAPWIRGAFEAGRANPVSRERIDRANAAQSAPQVGGAARLDVNVKAPRGTKVDADGGDVFKEVKTNRMHQMSRTPSGDSSEQPNWIDE